MSSRIIDGAHFDELLADLDRTVEEFVALLQSSPGLWAAHQPGKWTGGQHAEHVARSMELPLAAMDHARAELHAGTLARPPGRGPLQSLFFATVVRPGWMPRGGKAVAPAHPTEAPDVVNVIGRLRAGVGRFRELGRGLSPADRDRLWIRNPFMTAFRWHYTLPEVVRIQAVHARHHLNLVRELGESP